MATANFDIAPDNSTDAAFRAWTLALHNAIAAILTFVTQTGEIDFTTVLKPSANNQDRGFRCYRFSDANQATYPVFIRIDFGSGGTGTGNAPAIAVRIGQALDGSGNLSVPLGGNLMTSERSSPDKVSSATVFTSRISGDGGRLTMDLFHGFTTTSEKPWFVNVERTPDTSGVYEDKAVGLDMLGGSTQHCYTLTKDGRSKNVKITNSFMPWPYEDNDTTAALGLRVALIPVLRIAQSRVYNAVTGWMIYHNADYEGTGNELISVYGSNKTYFMTQRGISLIQGSSTVHRAAIRND
jgi:hypothetical protein